MLMWTIMYESKDPHYACPSSSSRPRPTCSQTTFVLDIKYQDSV
ncbi:unnamed protein product [Amoebophrya sp. A25]|nr:unnamed protein product [Amoebophrya sp. A25]|eukprot:GSA25T00002405001.1